MALERKLKGKEEIITVMIVENYDGWRRQFVELMKLKGYNIIEAYDGYHALKILEKSKIIPDIFFVDKNMPNMEGHELMQHLRGDERYKDTPIIIVTAEGSIAGEDLAKKYGATDYLTKENPETAKGFDAEKAEDMIREYVKKARR